jgi:hypothetical protein
VDKKDLTIGGTGKADLQITLDYSDSLYRAELSLKPKESGQSSSGSDSEEAEALNEAQSHIAPAMVDFSRKYSTTYIFSNVFSGEYELKLRSRFKEKQCSSSVTATIRSWGAATGGASLEQPGAF